MTDNITELLIILQTLDELKEREENNLIHELMLESQEAYQKGAGYEQILYKHNAN